ncbi:uncharacterized protein LOC134184491 [Corticium candelabrum]|uniref:uncharacterized protein LOC134184491 n=1 Tax=Corticium candelabrum TaxID=121492 RepID=UPI002E340B4C|nr:uncharacterized protein LOC134184491 [Corticium candelabrum]
MLYVLAFLVASRFFSEFARATDVIESCSIPTTECRANLTCNTTLTRVVQDCALIYNNTCSVSCVGSYYNNLLEDSIGRRLRDCDCGNDAFCSSLRESCSKCADVKSGCDSDDSCKLLQRNLDGNCTNGILRTPPNCTQACRNSLTELLANPIGKGRVMCNCGIDDLACKQFESVFRSVCLDATVVPPVVTGVLHTDVPPTVTPTVSADNCLRVVDRCSGSSSCNVEYSYVKVNCTTSQSMCTADCKTSLINVLSDQIGAQLPLCTCKPDDSSCMRMAVPATFQKLGRLCNVTVATPLIPTLTPTRSGALKLIQIEMFLLPSLLLMYLL